jgi:exodeoxyribonuclease VII large subunit
LQGDKAVESINRQLEAIRKSKNNFDVVVIIRGGGADVGLTCFDNYLLARNIADFPLPVISGIGHSTNETVVEMVSNQNKITPTDVAYFFLKCYDNIFDLLNNFENEIFDIAENIISLESHRLIEAVQQYKTLSMNLLKNAEYKFEMLSNSSNKTIRDFISNKKQEFNNLTEKITLRPRQIVEGQKIMLENKISFIQLFNKQYLKNNSNKLNILLSKTELLDPKNVLKRGYSITKFKGKVLKDPKGVNENDIIETELFLGTIKSIVGKAK